MEMPVYLFTGFLDAGKTKFIQETLEDPRFYDGERTLVILCEEGEEEYDPSKYPSENVFFHVIEDQEQLNQKNLLSLQKKYRMQRVLIEYNGMWLLNELYTALPDSWMVYQEMTFADSKTIMTYNANMRNLVGDKLSSAEMVIFNRLEKGEDLMPYHKLVRGITRRANIAYEYADGDVEYDDIQDPLPFDINAPIIEIADEDYAIWYRDLMEETDKYANKTVKFKGIIAKNPKLDNKSFAIGRHIMTCCEDDIAFGGLIALWKDSDNFESRDWATICAKIVIEHCDAYDGKGPVLHATAVDLSLPPEQELATFY